MNGLHHSRILRFSSKTFGLTKRFNNTAAEENVRVRFAPSPTGFVHLGGLRTALYNHLFAKSKNGTTIIRIEDTDQTRIVPNAAKKIIEDLEWCGIHYDEGPYYQSERKELYQKHAKMLIDSGEAYYCFCTQARLNLLRRELQKSGEVVKYDNKCRFLSEEEVEAKLKKNESYCIRFKLSDAIVECEDLIYGHHGNNLAKIEGDPIILKADGFPTYHLANVVDDHYMNISHVLRGSEWLVSTIKHLLMFRAFNWKPPQYGHLPLLLNSDGTKFSKRQNDLRISHFRDMGIFPNALLNVVTRAGGGFDIFHADRDEKNFTLDELIQMFDLSKVNKTSCKLPIERLQQSNRMEMKRMMKNDSKKLVDQIQNHVRNHFNQRDNHLKLCIDSDYILKVLNIIIDRIHRFDDLVSKEFQFIWIMPEIKFEESSSLTTEKMKGLLSELNTKTWDNTELNNFFKEFAKSQNVVYKELMETLRLLLTSLKQGPSVVEILQLLGKENSLSRLHKSLS